MISINKLSTFQRDFWTDLSLCY